ncbi:uncharacterized protein LODBEIA_P01360 [Lodderomyces beijingensis]|uniref:Uncharacterized protein n=1 Tax=Lodderomyces beijingensis TaxID=1775926 RepID=A0ABP0ZIB4_9ASCO
MKSQLSVTAYRSRSDLLELKKWFYEFNGAADRREEAIQRVQVFNTRGRLPHGIEATSHLTSTLLQDEKNPDVDTNILQLSYTMALIRFVNGLLDPFQQAQFAIPMQLLAKQLGLPSFFVELRHMGTHENLPSLDLLRTGCREALNWLYDHYWCHVGGDCQDKDEEEGKKKSFSENKGESSSEIAKFRLAEYANLLSYYSVYDNLKFYKQARKGDPAVPLFPKVKTEKDYKLLDCLAELKSFNTANSDLFADIVLRRYIIIYPSGKLKAKNIKYNPLFAKLYRPLFDFLGLEFKLRLFTKIMDEIDAVAIVDANSTTICKPLGLAVTFADDEVAQLAEWVPQIIQDVVVAGDVEPVHELNIKSRSDVVEFVITRVEAMTGQSLSKLNLFQILRDAVAKKDKDSISTASIEKKLADLKKLQKSEESEKPKLSLALPPSLDELFAEDNPKKRKMTTDGIGGSASKKRADQDSSNEEKVHFLLEPHQSWKPTPFGICP